MAVVTDNLAYTPSYQAFETPPGAVVINSVVPRGVRRFFFNNVVAAKPVNDQIDVFLTATLPGNFAYIINRFNLSLFSDVASDWDPHVLLRIQNHIPNQPIGVLEEVLLRANLFTNSNDDPRRVVTAESSSSGLHSFTAPMWAIGGGESFDFRVAMTNQAAAVGAAGFLITHVEFLEYDLTQAQRYFINTPIPVLSR